MNRLHYRSKLKEELADHCDEYYLANPREMQNQFLTKRQYRMLKCIFWVMCLGEQSYHGDRLDYGDMFNELKALMNAWDKYNARIYKDIEKASK